MNLLIGTLSLFSSIMLAFFGLPITILFISSLIFPATITPNPRVSSLEAIEQVHMRERASIETEMMPITIKKELHKGNIIWVDAEPIIA